MNFEQWVAAVLSATLHVPVEVHDDGSEPSMYDLRVGPKESPLRVIEACGAVDEVATELWNIGPAQGAISLAGLRRSWTVGLRREARWQRVRANIAPILRDAELKGVGDLRALPGSERRRWESLGVAFGHAFDGTAGKVDFTVETFGGFIDGSGSSLPDWIADFVGHSERDDNLAKVRRAPGTPMRELFVYLTMGGAPWEVESYFHSRFASLPIDSPDVPTDLHGVWVAHAFGEMGVRWGRTGWSTFTVPRELPNSALEQNEPRRGVS